MKKILCGGIIIFLILLLLLAGLNIHKSITLSSPPNDAKIQEQLSTIDWKLIPQKTKELEKIGYQNSAQYGSMWEKNGNKLASCVEVGGIWGEKFYDYIVNYYEFIPVIRNYVVVYESDGVMLTIVAKRPDQIIAILAELGTIASVEDDNITK